MLKTAKTKEARSKVKILPQAAKELSEIEARKAKGGLIINWAQSDHRNAAVKDGTSNTFLVG